MGAHLDRALLLVEQSRHDQAAEELRQELAEDPDNARAHALLALCLVHREEFREATDEARLAVHQGPDMDFCHYALASVLHDRDMLDEAAEAVNEAIRLDPEDADYYALLAAIRVDQRDWPGGLDAAEQGLRVDSEHVPCTNLRAIALTKLGRRAEAGATIDAALAKQPDNAVTHANQGWTLLHDGKAEKAMEHFREALRLDPTSEWARQGIVEALKARNTIYSLMLRYFLWMSGLSGRAQWGLIIGAYIGYRVLLSITRGNPTAAPYLWPVLIAYIVFMLMTWISMPLFNLVLRLNRFGRLALSREQVFASNCVGAVLLAALCALVYWLAQPSPLSEILALYLAVMIVPTAGTFNCSKGWPRTVMAIYVALLFLTAGTLVATVAMDPPFDSVSWFFRPMAGAFLWGAILSPWVANGLATARPKR